MGAAMKAYFRYQKGYQYEEHGAWYVRYRQRVPQEDGSSRLKHISKHLGRSKDFSNIFLVERCRASFMQTVNQDRLSTNPRITLTAFVEGLYLPWTKEERRASTSTGHRGQNRQYKRVCRYLYSTITYMVKTQPILP